MKQLCLMMASLAIPQVAYAAEPKTAPPTPEATRLLTADVLIVDSRGVPISGVKVTPWALRSNQGHGTWRTPNDDPKDPPSTTTDEEGHATVSYPEYTGHEESSRVTSLSLRLIHDDFAGTDYNDVPTPAASEVRIEMQRGAVIKLGGLINNELVPNDRLYAEWSSGAVQGCNLSKDEAGFVVLPRLTSGSKKFRLVQLPEKGPALFSAVQSLELANEEEYPLLLPLRPSITIEGKVSENVPRPIKDGRVVADIITPLENEDDQETLSWSTWTEIREDGSFTLRDLPPGEFLQIIALCDGFHAASGEAPPFATERERTSTGFVRPQVFELVDSLNQITIAMQETSTAEVTVMKSGEPQSNLVVAAFPNVGWWNSGSQIYCHPLFHTRDRLVNPEAFAFTRDIPFQAKTNELGQAQLVNLPAIKDRGTSVYLYEDGDSWKVVGDENGYTVALKPGVTVERTIELQPPESTKIFEDAARQLFKAIGK